MKPYKNYIESHSTNWTEYYTTEIAKNYDEEPYVFRII